MPVFAVDRRIGTVSTPLQISAWTKLLQNHPDSCYVDYLLQGIQNGFHIGFDRSRVLRSAKSNMKSAKDHPEVVQDYLQAECTEGRVLGPLNPLEWPYVHISKFGVIPKRHQKSKWRLIVDLSHPDGVSVNDGIRCDLCSLSYSRVDDVAQTILSLGRGAALAKIDVKSAYRIIPVHPDDRYLLGMLWQDQLFIDTALPFGLRSAPKIFNAVADGLEWILKVNGVRHLQHYLDDFITVGAPDSGECDFNCRVISHFCSLLGVPLAKDKCEGPTTCLTYLGIEVDSVAFQLRLPQDKLGRLSATVEEWSSKKSCTKRDLSSLVGQLHHAASVVKPGRSFLRRMFDLLSRASKPHHHIKLTSGFRSDLAWWRTFLKSWNGVSMLSPAKARTQPPDAVVTSDASGKWGCGAFWKLTWFQFAWEKPLCNLSIAIQELIPIIVAAAIWGKHWKGYSVQCQSDNQAVVAVYSLLVQAKNHI